MDHDAEVLKEASRAVLAIDVKYRQADFKTKRQLKPKRDEVYEAYARARLALLAEGMLCTRKDVETMAGIREEVSRAKKLQSLLVAIGRFTAFLARL